MLHILTYFIDWPFCSATQYIKGLSWHMPYAIFYNISYTFLPLTAVLPLFQTVSR